MSRFFVALWLAGCFSSPALSYAAGEALPEDAARLVAAFDEDSEAIRAEAEEKIVRQKHELAAKLKLLQDEYCRQAKLDEAVAIRDKIRELLNEAVGAKPDPGNAFGLSDKIGSRHLFMVTGNTNGIVWGTDVYTTDSAIATAAVHSGVLKPGETGVVRVTLLPGRDDYLSSTRNGVTSNPWQNYPTSFSVERVAPAGPRPPEADTKEAVKSLKAPEPAKPLPLPKPEAKPF